MRSCPTTKPTPVHTFHTYLSYVHTTGILHFEYCHFRSLSKGRPDQEKPHTQEHAPSTFMRPVRSPVPWDADNCPAVSRSTTNLPQVTTKCISHTSLSQERAAQQLTYKLPLLQIVATTIVYSYCTPMPHYRWVRKAAGARDIQVKSVPAFHRSLKMIEDEWRPSIFNCVTESNFQYRK